MGEVNFYVKKPAKGSGKSVIYLKFTYNGNIPFIFAFGQNISPSNWNRDKQRVKNNKQTTEEGQYYLNDLIREFS